MWLQHVRDVRDAHREELDALDEGLRWNRLCELNVVEQVRHVAQTDIVRAAWARQQPLDVHGWIYAIENGLLRDLGITINGPEA